MLFLRRLIQVWLELRLEVMPAFSSETCLDSGSCLASGAETIVETHDGKVRIQVDNESEKDSTLKKQRAKYLVVIWGS
jgi:hypothetical protein